MMTKMNFRWKFVCLGKSFAVQEEVSTHNVLCNFKQEVKFSLGTGIVCLFYFVTTLKKKKFPDKPEHSGYNLKFNLEIFI